ncbi:MAG: S8 family serine peptidase [Longimicrobiales bacterium]
MRRFALLFPIAFLIGCSDAPEQFVGPPEPDPISPAEAFAAGPQQVMAFQPGVVVARFQDRAPVAEIAAAQGASVARTLRQGIHVLNVPEGREQAVVMALSRNPRVLFAELSVPRTLGIPCGDTDGDCTVPSDELFGRRWDLHNDGTVRDANGDILEDQGLVPDADMDWLEAHERLGAFTEGALIGIVDTGIFPSHEDLSGRLLVQHDFFNIDPIAEDDHGHGTHASGIMLAHGDNGKGASGIAYGPNIRLAMAKGCGNTIIGYLCWSPDIADGIMWLADQGVVAINLSLGGESPSSAEQVALQYARDRNVLPICAAGNDSGAVDWPGAFPECMAVSSTGWNDALASYSSFGQEVEVAAPGGEILHANYLDMILSTWLTGGYAYMAGTSMAAPQVTGLAGLLHALGVTGADEKRALIRATADDLGAPGFDILYGDGRINVWAAVQAAVGEPPPPPPTDEPPVASFTWSCTDLACEFTDASTDDGGVTSWLWDFGDGSATSPQQSPSHDFPAGGTYTVTLTVTDAADQSDLTQQDVTVTEPPPPPPNEDPVASFTYACTGLTCQFTDTSTDDQGVVAWLWDFGDGLGWSDQQHPTYTYAAAGTYLMALLVEDAEMGLGYTEQELTVIETPPVLTAVKNKIKGQQVTDLSWVGTVKPVDLYRDGSLIAGGVPSDPPTYRDFTGVRGKATFVYTACLAGTDNCSDPVTVVY